MLFFASFFLIFIIIIGMLNQRNFQLNRCYYYDDVSSSSSSSSSSNDDLNWFWFSDCIFHNIIRSKTPECYVTSAIFFFPSLYLFSSSVSPYFSPNTAIDRIVFDYFDPICSSTNNMKGKTIANICAACVSGFLHFCFAFSLVRALCE